MGDMVLREARRVRSFALDGARVNVESSRGQVKGLKGVRPRAGLGRVMLGAERGLPAG